MNTQLLHKLFLIGLFSTLALSALELPNFFSPPNWGQTISFRIILSLIIFIFGVFLFYKPDFIRPIHWKNKESIGFWLLSGLFITYLLSTIFSIDPNFSLWGNPVRSGGFINFISYGIIAFLAFFLLKLRHWKILWDIAIIVGIFISSVAIIQWQGLFSETLISAGRPTSTLGSPIMLAIYALLLLFPSITFGLKEQNKLKKVFYIASSFLFLFIVIITQTRAVYLGLIIASSYFLFSYPFKQKLQSVAAKSVVLLILTLLIGSIYYVNAQEELPRFIRESKILHPITERMNLDLLTHEPRPSTWRVGLEAIKERPLLGYGPENFSIAFDKHYDPSLPNIQYIPEGENSWWDKAHNTFIGTAVESGVLALILFLALFIVLLWQLQKIKKGSPEHTIIIHGIQAAFIGYLIGNFFAFNTFSTYLISFLLISYSLFLIHNLSNKEEVEQAPNKLLRYKKPILISLAVFLIWFNWQYSIVPLQINAKINQAESLISAEGCDLAIETIEEAFIQKDTFLNAYTSFRYAHILNSCGNIDLEKAPEYNQRGYELLKESTQARPTFTRNWIFLGTSINIMLEQARIGILPNLSPEKIEDLTQEKNNAFLKANELSPKRQEVYIEWIRGYIVAGDFQIAKEKSDTCIALDSNTGICWWLKGLSEIFLNESEQAKKDIDMAQEMGFDIHSTSSLKQLIRAYVHLENFSELIRINKELIELEPDVPQYHSALASTYKIVGDYANARREALIVLELQPEAREVVEAFLKTLP
ncbi:MAG: O-antigen ligase family protein [Patescibacteria group bacterium]|nr:O-antigen ligase family protein [Patescibacteria group bacterium]